MKIIRLISWFDKETDKLIDEVDITEIDLEILKSIFKPTKEDPLMYFPYWIHQKEADELKKHIDLEFNFEKYVYDLGCFKDNFPKPLNSES